MTTYDQAIAGAEAIKELMIACRDAGIAEPTDTYFDADMRDWFVQWGDHSTEFYAGVQVCMRTGSYTAFDELGNRPPQPLQDLPALLTKLGVPREQENKK